MSFPRHGLYAITQTDHKSPDQILGDVSAALQAGITVLQYRDKNPINAVDLACRLHSLCQSYRVPLIINDSIELALASGAEGVHLGRDDGDVHQARQLLGKEAYIGVSCYNDVNKAVAMADLGVDYVAFGRFYPSGTKPLAAPAELVTLQHAKSLINIPIVAIGGITPDNGSILLEAGADLLAVVGGIFDHDPAQAVKHYQRRCFLT